MSYRDLRVATILVLISVFVPLSAPGADWPMWRYDAGRTGSSVEQLGDELQLVWTRKFPARKQAWDDALNMDLMPYDRVFEPIVVDGKMFLGFNDRDQLLALDAATGERCWTFITEGPVRLPPVGSQGRIYFTSDDGKLYCVDAKSGRLLWEFQGGPGRRHVIGNSRLISAWPARGGAVIRDGHAYFAASIWPFMGVFIYALDAETGAVAWVNDETGSQYIKQPHSASSFAGVAPQGALVATQDMLLVPGGRSVPAAFDRKTGAFRYYELNASGKGTGGSLVIADEQSFYVHTRLKGTREFNLATGVKTAFTPNEPVLSGGLIYTAETDEGHDYVRAYDSQKKMLWQIEASGGGDLILAGTRLYAAGKDVISAIQLPRDGEPAKLVGKFPAPGQIERLLAADEKLFAVTLDGQICAFGTRSGVEPPTAKHWQESHEPLQPSAEAESLAAALLRSGDAQGYALWFGSAEHVAVQGLAAQSPFIQFAVIDTDQQRVDRLQRRLDAAGLLGRVTVHRASPADFGAPPYIAQMVFADPAVASELAADRAALAAVYESVRPYGGVLQLLSDAQDSHELADRVRSMELEQAEIEIVPHGVIIKRAGALPGSADWTHQHGDVANTIKSNDSRVKLPLGVLWFGGNSHADILPRHGHGPPEQVIGGRLFIQGINSLSARDVYTGRVLWKRQFEDLGTLGVYFDSTYRETPLDTAYNQVHIPGANGRGTNFVATDDRIYILERSICHVLDPASGETVTDISLPTSDPQSPQEWGYIGVYQDVLIGGIGFANYQKRHDLPKGDLLPSALAKKAVFGVSALDRSASAGLVGFDRHTGRQLWRIDALHSFWHNGIVAGGGRIYCLDKNPQPVEDFLKRRGTSQPDTYRIVAIDYRTGRPTWEVREGIFGTWLGYSEKFDLLLQAGASASDRLAAEVGQGIAVYRGISGDLQWKKESLKYSGPCVLHNDTIITNANANKESAGAFNLLDGAPQLVANPITGEMQPWRITRTHGCNTIVASENLLTFRSGAAGFYDLLTHSGTGNFGGFKSGCTSNLIVANGVLNAPDYTRTCSCAYQNQTSLALVHMPEIDVWSVNVSAQWASDGQRLKHFGVNFGAPGDRQDPGGVLWLEFPEKSGESSRLPIEIEGAVSYYQDHSSGITRSEVPWIMASGVEGLRKLRMRMQTGDSQQQDDMAPAPAAETEESYQLRLLFGSPRQLKPQRRVFDVWAQGRRVLENVTIDSTNNLHTATVVHTVNDVLVGRELELRFEAKEGEPLLSGLEVKAD